jgi:hypothetical protein
MLVSVKSYDIFRGFIFSRSLREVTVYCGVMSAHLPTSVISENAHFCDAFYLNVQ